MSDDPELSSSSDVTVGRVAGTLVGVPYTRLETVSSNLAFARVGTGVAGTCPTGGRFSTGTGTPAVLGTRIGAGEGRSSVTSSIRSGADGPDGVVVHRDLWDDSSDELECALDVGESRNTTRPCGSGVLGVLIRAGADTPAVLGTRGSAEEGRITSTLRSGADWPDDILIPPALGIDSSDELECLLEVGDS